MACTHTVRPDIRLVNAGGQSKAPTADQERGDEQRGVDSKAVFLRLSQAAVHSRAADSGCSIQADFQDGRIRPCDDSRSPPRCSLRSAFGLCLGRSG
jgi:hypothetical protein